MIRLIQRRLIIPRGDTGAFSIPYLKEIKPGDIAVFTIFDQRTQTRLYQKLITAEGDMLNIAFSHNDTVNLKPGKYLWDIKFYSNPQFVDDELVNGEEVDSYYAGFNMPVCEIRETADNYLISTDSPTATLSPEQLDIITKAINNLNEAIEKTNLNVTHYPIIRNNEWYVWNSDENIYISTGVSANGLIPIKGIDYWTEEDQNSIVEEVLEFLPEAHYVKTEVETSGRYIGLNVWFAMPYGNSPNKYSDVYVTVEGNEHGVNTSIHYPVTEENGMVKAELKCNLLGAANLYTPYLHFTDNEEEIIVAGEPQSIEGYVRWADINLEDEKKLTYLHHLIDFAYWFQASRTSHNNSEITLHYTDDYDYNSISEILEEYISQSISTNETRATIKTIAISFEDKAQLRLTFSPKGSYTINEGSIDNIPTSLISRDSGTQKYLQKSMEYIEEDFIKYHTFKCEDVEIKACGFTYLRTLIKNSSDINTKRYAASLYNLIKLYPTITSSINKADKAIELINEINSHTPIINNENWNIWDTETHTYVDTGVKATGDIPNITIGTVQEGSNAEATITGTTENPVLNLTLPNANVPINISQLNNDVGYLTSYTETDPTVPAWAKEPNKPAYTAAEVGAPTVAEMNTAIGTAIGNINSFDIAIVQTLPTQDINTHTIYLIPKVGETNDVYDEYIYINSKWEMVGNTQIDLSDYALKNELPTKISELDNDSGYLTQHQDVSGKANSADLALVATSGSYNDLSNKPSIPTRISDLIDDSEHYITPGNQLLSQILCPDFSATWNSRKITKAGNTISSKWTASNSTTVLTYFTGTVHKIISGSTMANVSADADQLIPLSTIGVNPKLTINISTSYTGSTKSCLYVDYYKIVDEAPVRVSYIRITSDTMTNDKGIIVVPFNIPAEATHFALAYYTAGAGPSSVVALGMQQDTDVVHDVQVDGVSILSDGVANVPLSNYNLYGATKLQEYGGLKYDNDGSIQTDYAASSQVKAGVNSKRPLVPLNQHESAFYGLAKAAGDITQSESSNAVGTYTDEAKAAINIMIGSVSKESLKNAGISVQTYTEKFNGEFTVTTATTSGWLNPYARASITGRISKHYMHRVTLNGTEYILPTRLWYSTSNGDVKVYEYLGNLGLYISDISGVPEGTDNVPFVIISDLNNSSSIDVLTQTAGIYTILVEQINNTQIELPKSLIWKDSYVPIEKNNNGGTYNGYSIGVNELKNQRGTFAFGYGNRIENNFGFAIGEANILKCSSSYVEGSGNEVTGFNSMVHSNHVEGYLNKFTKLGLCNHIEGMDNKSNKLLLSNTHIEGTSNEANGNFIHIEGFDNIANGEESHIEGLGNIGNGNGIHIQGRYNVADIIAPEWVANTEYFIGDYIYKTYVNSSTPYGCFVCIENNNDSVFTVSKWKKVGNGQYSDTLMLIGNGLSETNRSNALKIDWLGNMYLGGNVYVNSAADSTGGTKVATVEDIPDIQIATFYGLAKAAGDTTQSASSNAVGTYTNEAKLAIQQMLGIETTTVNVNDAAAIIVAEPNHRYICGEVTSVDFTPCTYGLCELIFTSSSTVAVLTLPATVKMPEWFEVEAGRIYDIIITDGVYGAVTSWAM